VVSFLRPIAKEQNIEIVYSKSGELEKARVLTGPLFYTVVNLCMKLLNEQYKTIKIEPRVEQHTLAISVSAVFKEGAIDRDSLLFGNGLNLSPGGIFPGRMLDSFNGTISVQKRQKGHRIVLTLPLAEQTVEKSVRIQ
jgi:hypothetical protein